MAATRLALVRHAVTAHSEQKRWSGHTDEPLTERGQWMAARLGERFAGLDVAAVYCSPLPRARETAEPIAAALRTDPVIVDELKECGFGAWDGVEFAQVARDHPEALQAYFRGEAPAGETGETIPGLCARVEPFLDTVLERHAGATVVAVTHGGPIRAMIRKAMDIPMEKAYRLQQDHGSVTILEHGSGWIVRASNDTGHLGERSALGAPGRESPFTQPADAEKDRGVRGTRAVE